MKAVRSGDHRVLAGLELFAKIFHVDADSMRAGESIAQRFVRRQSDSAPLLAQLQDWIRARQADVEPKSALGKAITTSPSNRTGSLDCMAR